MGHECKAIEGRRKLRVRDNLIANDCCQGHIRGEIKRRDVEASAIRGSGHLKGTGDEIEAEPSWKRRQAANYKLQG